METLKTYPFDELTQAPERLILGAKRHNIRLLISDFHDSPDLKKIVVIVNWADHKGYMKQYALTTLRSRYALRASPEQLSPEK